MINRTKTLRGLGGRHDRRQRPPQCARYLGRAKKWLWPDWPCRQHEVGYDHAGGEEAHEKIFPRFSRRSMTFDNGKEFAEHRKLTRELGLEVYFTDPYASWQRA